jgi:hypothetical protein
MTQFYIRGNDGETIGPLTIEEVRDRLDQGGISLHTEAFTTLDGSRWQPLHAVLPASFRPVASDQAELIPPAAPVGWVIRLIDSVRGTVGMLALSFLIAAFTIGGGRIWAGFVLAVMAYVLLWFLPVLWLVYLSLRRIFQAAIALALLLAILAGVELWRTRQREEFRLISVLKGSMAHSGSFSPDGERILLTYGSARVWDRQTLRLSREFKPEGYLEGAAYSPDGRWIATATSQSLDLWDANSGAASFTLADRAVGEYKAPAFSKDGKLLVARCHGGFKVWDLQRRAEVAGGDESVESVAISPDGRWVATPTISGPTLIWETAKGPGNRNPIFTVPARGKSAMFHPSGHQLLVVGASTVTLFSFEASADVGESRVKTEYLASLGQESDAGWIAENELNHVTATFSPDGRWILVGGADGSVTLWNAGTIQMTKVLKKHDPPKLNDHYFRASKPLPFAQLLAGSFSTDGRFVLREKGSEIAIWALPDWMGARESKSISVTLSAILIGAVVLLCLLSWGGVVVFREMRPVVKKTKEPGGNTTRKVPGHQGESKGTSEYDY